MKQTIISLIIKNKQIHSKKRNVNIIDNKLFQ